MTTLTKAGFEVDLLTAAVREDCGPLVDAWLAKQSRDSSSEAVEYRHFALGSTEDLNERISAMMAEQGSRCIIVVSDELTRREQPDRDTPTDLTGALRQRFADSRHFLGLVAIVDGDARRVADIDRTVSQLSLDVDTLARAIELAAEGVRLKCRPPKRTRQDKAWACAVDIVNSPDELRDSFRLRFDVYDKMGYLSDPISTSGHALDIDQYDARCIHFIAKEYVKGVPTGRIAGSVRLVLPAQPGFLRTDPLVDPRTVYFRHKRWAEDLVADVGHPAIRGRFETRHFYPLPIMNSFDFRTRRSGILKRIGSYCELSRLVVPGPFRGAGVSNLLVRATILAAYLLKMKTVLLECIPQHERMYRKHGFKTMEGSHTRVADLDQQAIGMYLHVDDSLNNVPVQRAKQNIALLQRIVKAVGKGKGHLCLCSDTYCWKRSLYQNWQHPQCPLLPLHLRRDP